MDSAASLFHWVARTLCSFEFLFVAPIMALFVNLVLLKVAADSLPYRLAIGLLSVLAVLYVGGGVGALVEHRMSPIQVSLRVSDRDWSYIRNKDGGITGSSFRILLASDEWPTYSDGEGKIYARVRRGDMLDVSARPLSEDWVFVTLRRTGEQFKVGPTSGQILLRFVSWFPCLWFIGWPAVAYFRKRKQSAPEPQA